MKSVQYLAVFLFITGAPFAQSKDFVTDLCEANKGNEFISQVDACITLSKADFFTKILDSDIYQATCDLLSDELECWITAQNNYNCWTDEEMGNVRINTILEEIERANNQSSFLGESYIASCPILRDFRKNYINQRYGYNSPCTFNEIQERLKLKKTCEEGVRNKGRFLENFVTGIDSWKQIFCYEYTGSKECQEIILTCKNDQQRAITEQKNKQIYDDDEEEIQGISGFEDFTYAGCQGISRRRRDAFMGGDNSLNEAQEEALKRILKKRSTRFLMD